MCGILLTTTKNDANVTNTYQILKILLNKQQHEPIMMHIKNERLFPKHAMLTSKSVM